MNEQKIRVMVSNHTPAPVKEAQPDDVNLYNVGDAIVFGTNTSFQVEACIPTGGMGVVYKVRHTGWNISLAMKQQNNRWYTKTKKDRDMFISECEAWMGLGLHPNTVCCYFVLMLDDAVPTVFSEWQEAGSLADWIKDGRLYKGTEAEILERILNFAIQAARGLKHAHKHQPVVLGEGPGMTTLVHQDVKPDNIMISKEGLVKITDFGIARARALTDSAEPKDAAARLANAAVRVENGRTVYVTALGYTKGYEAPEQSNGRAVSRRTDIFGFAVSILETIIGRKCWLRGMDAKRCLHCLGRHPENGKLPASDISELLALLNRCIEERPEDRPKDFSQVEAELLILYRRYTGREFNLAAPLAADLLSSSLNNLALSCLELGRPQDALKYWELVLERQPDHPDSVFNRAVWFWRNAKIDDVTAAVMIENMYSNNKDDYTSLLLYINLCLERYDYDELTSLVKNNNEILLRIPYVLKRRITNLIGSDSGWLATPKNEIVRHNYGELLHFKPETNELSACSVFGAERYKLTFSNEAPKAELVYSFAWPKEQLSALCLSADGSLMLTHAGTRRADADKIISERLPNNQNNVAEIMRILVGSEAMRVHPRPEGIVAKCMYEQVYHDIYELTHLESANHLCLWSLDDPRLQYKLVSELFKTAVRIDARIAADGLVYTTAWDAFSGELCIWHKGERVRSHVIPEPGVTASAFSPDGKYLLTGSEEGAVRLYETDTFKLLSTLSEPEPVPKTEYQLRMFEAFRKFTNNSSAFLGTREIVSLTFFPDGDEACAVSADGSFRQWRIPGGGLQRAYQKCFLKDMYISPGGRLAITAYDVFRLMDLETGRCLSTGRAGLCTCVFLPGMDDALMVCRSLSHGKKRTSLWCFQMPLPDAKPDLLWAISKVLPSIDQPERTQEAQIRLERARAAIDRMAVPAALAELEAAYSLKDAVSSESLRLLNQQVGAYCKKNGMRSVTPLRSYTGETFNAFAFAPDGSAVLNNRRYDIVMDEYGLRFERDVYVYAFSPDGALLFTSSGNTLGMPHAVYAMDARTGTLVSSFTDMHGDRINSLAVSRDGKYLLSASDDCTAKLWRLKQHFGKVYIKPYRVLQCGERVKNAVFGPGKESVVTLASRFERLNGEVMLWHAGGKRVLHSSASCISAGSDGKKLLVGYFEGLELFQLPEGNILWSGTQMSESINADVSFCKDERFAVSITNNGETWYWDLNTGKRLLSYKGRGSRLAVHPSGEYVVTYPGYQLLQIDYIHSPR
jgi:WD40 repeat protein/serine/threonine protein kinase